MPPPALEVNGSIGQLATGDIYNHHHWHETEPPDDPDKSVQCPQCGRLTWKYTRRCIHCQFDAPQRRGRRGLRMTMHVSTLAVLLLSAFAAGAALAQEHPTKLSFYGLDIGAKVTAKACAPQHPAKGHCIERKGLKPGYTGRADVLFAFESLPRWVRGSRASARIVDGVLEGIVLYTDGRVDQVDAYRDLARRFGKPSFDKVEQATNGFGHPIEVVEAQWLAVPATIDLVGIVEGKSYGYVLIATPKGK